MIAVKSDVTGRASVPSEHSNEKLYVRFINKTQRAVDVIWIDFAGNYVRYTLLKHGQFVDVNTYKRHSWVAVDALTKDAMLLGGVYRYSPQISEETRRRMLHYRNCLPADVRIPVHITLPLYSLYFRTLLAVRDALTSEEDVQKLELPRRVREQLAKVCARKVDRGVLLPFGAGEL